METETTQQVIEATQTKEYPQIKDRMASSILVMLICGFLPGLIALIYTNKATDLYSQAMATDIVSVRDALYEKAVQKDKTSKTWIIIGLAIPAAIIIMVILASIFS